MSAAAAAMILGVVMIVLALVYFLVATILQLRKIVAGLDRVILHVGGIVEKSAPVGEVVNDINANLDAGDRRALLDDPADVLDHAVEPGDDLAQLEDRRDEEVHEREDDQDDPEDHRGGGGAHAAGPASSRITSSEPP